MPGVVEAVYHKSIDIPERFVLEIVFDVLEGILILADDVLALMHLQCYGIYAPIAMSSTATSAKEMCFI